LKWDADRYADFVKGTNIAGTMSEKEKNAANYFERTTLGKIHTPTTILDLHGKILLWYLPGILSPRVVCIFFMITLNTHIADV
jgi:hypothetical protein